MSVIAGISGGRRNAMAALCLDGRLVAACEQERLRRVRGIGLLQGGFPAEALEAVLTLSGQTRRSIQRYAVAETLPLPPQLELEILSHHFGHAATAFYTSPFDRAVVLVCDSHTTPELSCWRGEGGRLVPLGWHWEGAGFASVYSKLTRAFGLLPDWEEHKLEALARIGSASQLDRACELIRLQDNRLIVDRRLEERVDEWLGAQGRGLEDLAHTAEVASSLQERLADLLVRIVADLSRATGIPNICLGGGLFFNTFFNTCISDAGWFDRSFVPANPGNAGLAPGAALALGNGDASSSPGGGYSPFLGPGYDAGEIKAVLDNCKLSYDYLDENRLIDRAIETLRSGRLVGWFQGRMEWGPRALGNRSIVASPLSPYVVDNLSVFLKRREPHRGYSVSVCLEDLERFFDGPPSSNFMEHEYRIQNPELFPGLARYGAKRLRVHTVGDDPPLLRRLLKAFGEATGVPVLVNTSFNGFHEPMVCTPRDAVRIFYGTALDALVVGNFLMEK